MAHVLIIDDEEAITRALATYFERTGTHTVTRANGQPTLASYADHEAYGVMVFALRGQVLTTYTPNDVGNLQIAREDFIGSLAARETEGGVAFSNGFPVRTSSFTDCFVVTS